MASTLGVMATIHSGIAKFSVSYDVHDAWTQAYVGVRHLIYELLPPPGRKLSIEHQAMCQLALVGANHLMEVALYRYLESRPKHARLNDRKKTELRKATYAAMLQTWIAELADWSPALDSPPFQCTERLRRRRNDTVHKTPATANVPMCRSAIFSAVTGTRTMWKISGEAFPYQGFLDKYPIPVERPFSKVTFAR